MCADPEMFVTLFVLTWQYPATDDSCIYNSHFTSFQADFSTKRCPLVQMTALHLAAANDQAFALAKLTTSSWLDVNIKDAWDHTPLCIAIMRGSWACAVLLRSMGGATHCCVTMHCHCDVANSKFLADTQRTLCYVYHSNFEANS